MNQLLDLNADWTVDLSIEDAVAVYRKSNGRLRIDRSLQPTAVDGATWGGLVGGLVGGMLAAPFTGGASAAVAAAAVGAGALGLGTTGAVVGGLDAEELKEKYGLSEAFVTEVSGMVQPGQSALFLLADSDEPAKLTDRFRGYGGTILRSTLPAAEVKRLQSVLAATPSSAR
jgi:uncharacterized membrane protein